MKQTIQSNLLGKIIGERELETNKLWNVFVCVYMIYTVKWCVYVCFSNCVFLCECVYVCVYMSCVCLYDLRCEMVYVCVGKCVCVLL